MYFVDRLRQYRNKAEGEFAKEARKNGWKLTKRGWPDFICVRGEDVIVVEVKPTPNCKPKVEQDALLQLMARHGINCFVWNPETGFHAIKNK